MDAVLTTPPVVTGTSLAVLQAYPLGTLEVEYYTSSYGGTTMRDKVVGLRGYSSRVTLERASDMLLSEILPVLRPFSKLTDPLPDGTVPAVFALYEALGYPAALSQDGKKRITARFQPKVKDIGGFVRVEAFPGNQGGWIRLDSDSGAWTFEAFDDYSMGNGKAVDIENALAAYDYLRSQHFALPVNGRPLVEGVDFIAKPSA